MDRFKDGGYKQIKNQCEKLLILKNHKFSGKAYYYPGTPISIFAYIWGRYEGKFMIQLKQVFIICSILAFVFLLEEGERVFILWIKHFIQTFFNSLYLAYDRYALQLNLPCF